MLLTLAIGCGRDPAPAPPAPDVPPEPTPVAEPTPPPEPVTPAPTPPPAPSEAPEPPEDLAPALDEVRALKLDGDFAEAWRQARELRSRFAGHPGAGEIDHLVSLLSRYRREGGAAAVAIGRLAHEDPQVRGVAREQLRGGEEATWILLRRAVREEPAAPAAEAARTLAGVVGGGLAPAAAARLSREPEGELADTLVSLLSEPIGRGEAEALQAVYPLVRDDEADRFSTLLPSFLLALAEGFGGDEAAFGEAVGHPDAADRLRAALGEATGFEGEMQEGDAVAAALDMGDEAAAFRLFQTAVEAGTPLDGPFRLLRVTFHKSSGGRNMGVHQIEWREGDRRVPETPLTGNDQAPAPFRADAHPNPSQAWRVFDHSGRQRWGGPRRGSAWISLDVGPGQAATPTELRIRLRRGGNRRPGRVVAEGSMDGHTWVVLHDTDEHTDGDISWRRDRVALPLQGRAIARDGE